MERWFVDGFHDEAITRHGIGETITLEAFPDVQIEIAKLF